MPSTEFILLGIGILMAILVGTLVVAMARVLNSNKNLVDLVLGDRQETIQRRVNMKAKDDTIRGLSEELAYLQDAISRQDRGAGGGQLAEKLAEDRRQHDEAEEVSESDIGKAGRRSSRRLG